MRTHAAPADPAMLGQARRRFKKRLNGLINVRSDGQNIYCAWRISGVRNILPSSGCAPSAEHELQDGLLADRAAGKHFRDANREQ